MSFALRPRLPPQYLRVTQLAVKIGQSPNRRPLLNQSAILALCLPKDSRVIASLDAGECLQVLLSPQLSRWLSELSLLLGRGHLLRPRENLSLCLPVSPGPVTRCLVRLSSPPESPQLSFTAAAATHRETGSSLPRVHSVWGPSNPKPLSAAVGPLLDAKGPPTCSQSVPCLQPLTPRLLPPALRE